MEPRIIALTEGHLDRVIVERMLEGHDPDVYPKKEERQRGGKNAAISDAAVRARAGVARLVLALDINGGDEAQLCSRVEAKLGRALGNVRRDSTRRNTLLFGESSESPSSPRVCIWPVGLRSEPTVQSLGITRHSAEDLLIKALHVPECLASMARSELTIRVPDNPWGTLSEMLGVARARGAEINSSKDVLRIFLALIGYGAALATVGDRIIRCAQGTAAQAIFERPPEFELP